MINPLYIKALLAIAGCFLLSVYFAQETESATKEVPESEGASHETDVSEDNYRRFMELKDQQGERSLPTSAYVKPPSLEKMQNLPEASQKHLRNELRDIILEGEQWSPEQLEVDYPYNPSEAAGKDRELQRQESAAWDELVTEYHQREADIYAHSARSQAASMTDTPGSQSNGETGASSTQAGNSGSSAKGGNEGSPGENHDSMLARALAAGSSGESADDPTESIETKGVSQNALEFLQRSAGGAAMTQAPESKTSPENIPELSTAQDFPVNQQNKSADQSRQDQDQEATEIIYVSPGTLAIKDLGNAQGIVVIAPGTEKPDGDEGEEQETPGEDRDKHGEEKGKDE